MTPEFSRPIRVNEVEAGGTVIEITAEAAEREALAQRFELQALDSLVATVRLEPESGGAVLFSADLAADVVQACVVTLAPVPSRIEASFTRLYAPWADENLPLEEELSEDEPPDPIKNGVIDIGEALADQLGLELDPFPRAPGAAFEGFSTEPEDEREASEKAANPFMALAGLKKNGE